MGGVPAHGGVGRRVANWTGSIGLQRAKPCRVRRVTTSMLGAICGVAGTAAVRQIVGSCSAAIDSSSREFTGCCIEVAEVVVRHHRGVHVDDGRQQHQQLRELRRGALMAARSGRRCARRGAARQPCSVRRHHCDFAMVTHVPAT